MNVRISVGTLNEFATVIRVRVIMKRRVFADAVDWF